MMEKSLLKKISKILNYFWGIIYGVIYYNSVWMVPTILGDDQDSIDWLVTCNAVCRTATTTWGLLSKSTECLLVIWIYICRWLIWFINTLLYRISVRVQKLSISSRFPKNIPRYIKVLTLSLTLMSDQASQRANQALCDLILQDTQQHRRDIAEAM